MGKVINHNAEKGFTFYEPETGEPNTFIPPHLVESFNLTNVNPIQVEIEEYIDKRSGATKSKVKRLNKI